LYLDGSPDIIFTNGVNVVGDTKSLGFFTAGTELIFRLDVTFSGQSYFSGAASRNPDDVAHAAANTDAGETFVGFEDLPNGGDHDYNDLVFSFSNTVAGTVPEPASWAMMIGGFALGGAALRRRKAAVSFA
ncbi:MAG: PEPxxWA-CTERM sorting domain-containing protein, partial [Sphingobium sp.]|nr:PEPxxWA-CTERM sorting domain-containing protein [Sphingobium sp.]